MASIIQMNSALFCTRDACEYLSNWELKLQPKLGYIRSYEKNLRFLVESYQALLEMLAGSSSRPIFVFVGDGPARPSLEELCRVKRIPAKFIGHLSGEQLAESYASADVFA